MGLGFVTAGAAPPRTCRSKDDAPIVTELRSLTEQGSKLPNSCGDLSTHASQVSIHRRIASKAALRQEALFDKLTLANTSTSAVIGLLRDGSVDQGRRSG